MEFLRHLGHLGSVLLLFIHLSHKQANLKSSKVFFFLLCLYLRNSRGAHLAIVALAAQLKYNINIGDNCRLFSERGRDNYSAVISDRYLHNRVQVGRLTQLARLYNVHVLKYCSAVSMFSDHVLRCTCKRHSREYA